MRISTTMQFQKNLRYIQRANSNVDSTSERYNSGYKFMTAGEDPAGMSSKIKYTSAVAAYNQYSRNAGLAADSLAEEETALGSMWTALNSIHTRLIQSVDSTNDQYSLDALAEDIEQTKYQLFDLMNTQNAEGEYIFSGAESDTPCMMLNSTGQYLCQADGSERSVQVAPNVVVQTADSGLNIFQNCNLANSFTTTDAAGVLMYSQVSNYGSFDSIFNDYYSTSNTAQNDLTLSFTPSSSPDHPYGEYQITDYNGSVLVQGDVEKDGTIQCKGFEFRLNDASLATLSGGGAIGSVTLTLDAPVKDNILNQLTSIVNVLRDATLTTQDRTAKLAEMQITVENALNQYDKYRGRVGSRENEIEAVIGSDDALAYIKTEAKANVTEVDAFEAASDMVRAQQALTVSQQIYSKVTSSSLFDYI